MKKYLLFTAALMAVVNVNAQLKVNSTGKVGIGQTPVASYQFSVTSTKSGIQSVSTESTSNATAVGVAGTSYVPYHGKSIGIKGVSEGSFMDGKSFGVFGYAHGSGSGENYGVFGHVGPHVEGAGVYGSSYFGDDYGNYLNARYAGYFYGDVKVTSNLTVDGALLYSSDHLYSIVPENSSRNTATNYADYLQQLSANKYIYRPSRFSKAALNDNSVNDEESDYSLVEKQAMTKQHYGLDAAQLEEVFPDLVYENADGSKSINYMEMVPILVQAINELKAEINELKGTGAKKVQQTSAVESLIETTDAPALGQNVPNPFSSSTAIQVNIPESVQNAVICLYDLQGKKVKQMDIAARGKQSIKLSSTGLEEGMYLYSLIADGKVVQTRRMIVEK